MTTTIQEAEAVYREACDRYVRQLAEGRPTIGARRAAVRTWAAVVHAKCEQTRNDERAKAEAVSAA